MYHATAVKPARGGRMTRLRASKLSRGVTAWNDGLVGFLYKELSMGGSLNESMCIQS